MTGLESSHFERAAGFESLPTELQHQIFSYIYPPWYFRYTQEHDAQPQRIDRTGFTVVCTSAQSFKPQGVPLFSHLPAIGPLLACRAFYEAGRTLFQASFTGHIHIASRIIWREVHWRYAGIMALAKTMSITYPHLWSFDRTKFIRRLPNLSRMTVTFKNHGTQKMTYSIATSTEALDDQLQHNRHDGARETQEHQPVLVPIEAHGELKAWVTVPTELLPFGAIDESITKSIRTACKERNIELTWRHLFPARCDNEHIWQSDTCVAMDLQADSPFDISQVVRVRLVQVV
ncbi:hypothetical protein PMZ80_001160 [Knufia obscura]|uniref:Uncharacterized protein n=2 Tax=Knufia TaxID=430999 RepID=A0AAN8ICQ1_9EURO|nr:hypothetical protein PMZ80_001160 [Knufia obscura]KAK5958776.1 hypothetical protein OHC33_000619 [Knufia fluminis]